jgi:hypothetical protein
MIACGATLWLRAVELGAVDAQAEVLAPATVNVSATPTGSFCGVTPNEDFASIS